MDRSLKGPQQCFETRVLRAQYKPGIDLSFLTEKLNCLDTANIHHPAIVKLQPKAIKVKEKIYNLIIKRI